MSTVGLGLALLASVLVVAVIGIGCMLIVVECDKHPCNYVNLIIGALMALSSPGLLFLFCYLISRYLT